MMGRKVTAAITALTLAAGAVAAFEGQRTTPYYDVAGTLTVCYGHTRGVEGRKYTPAECTALLYDDLDIANRTVHRCITSPMTLWQEAALTSATFNLGPSAVCGSPLGELANRGRWDEACARLEKYVYAGGKRYPGLVRRRHAERLLCDGDL